MIKLLFLMGSFFFISVLKAEPLYSTQEAGESRIKPRLMDTNDLFSKPAPNEFTVGPVQRHTIQGPAFQNSAIFIIGEDAESLKWVKNHHDYLQTIHAVGIVASVSSQKAFDALKATMDLPLITANISGFSAFIGTTHYPVLLYNNWVLQ